MKRITLALAILALTASPVFAAVDLGGGRCLQSDGVEGAWNGSTADDAGCTTLDEYAANFSPDGLLARGVITGYTDNGDGTATLDYGTGITAKVNLKALDRPAAANPTPTSPTNREWFEETLNLRIGPR